MVTIFFPQITRHVLPQIAQIYAGNTRPGLPQIAQIYVRILGGVSRRSRRFTRAILGVVSRRSRGFTQTYYFEMANTMLLGINMGLRKSRADGMLNKKWVLT